MEKLYGVKELAERWHCTERTARGRMNQIGLASRKPSMCREGAIDAWERKNDLQSQWKPEPRGGKRRKAANFFPIQQGPLKPGQYISRVRARTEKAGGA